MADLIHIGYPKTGTTFLQTHVLPSLEGCAYLQFWGPGAKEFRPLIENLRNADDGDYLERTVSSFLDEWRTANPGPLLLTDENLSGAVLAAAFNWERNAERLKALLPEATVLVVVRHQQPMLRSVYSLYVQRGGYATFSDLLAGRAERARFDPEHLCYDRLVGRYQELFGASRVKVIPYELLATDAGRFYEDLTSLLGDGTSTLTEASTARENRSLSPLSRSILRRTNRLFRRSIYNAEPAVMPIAAAARLRGRLQRIVDPFVFSSLRQRLEAATEPDLPEWFERYVESNATLERMTGLDLSAFGYPLPN